MKSNRSVGNAVERELCEILFKQGWWAHNFSLGVNGTPGDIICVNKETAMLLDAKNCTKDYFVMDRIEPNQWTSAMMWREKVNNHAYLAIKMKGQFYLLDYETLSMLDKNYKRLSLTDLQHYAKIIYWGGEV